MDFHEMSSQGNLHSSNLTRRLFNLDAFEPYRYFIISSLEHGYTLNGIWISLPGRQDDPIPSACDFSHILCKWGFFREYVDFIPIMVHEAQIVINQIAQKMANEMSQIEAEHLWDSNVAEINPLTIFMNNRNPLAIVLLSKADARYRREKHTLYHRSALEDSTNDSISELPRQPDRKVCMTCGEPVDGVIYCSKQCRPSASLEWYSHRSTQAETPTITEGFCTARSRFISPSAGSCATHDTSQLVPPPYSLVDANPPTPKFVPVKKEPQEEAGIDEITLYSVPEKDPAWPSFVSPSHSRLASLRSYGKSSFHHNIIMKV